MTPLTPAASRPAVRLICLLMLTFTMLSRPATGAAPMHFTRVGSDSGLDSGGVMAIAQDAQGFLWFGTEDGLDRYDGYEVRHYGHDRDGRLPSNWISTLAQDARGILWIGTDGGGLNGLDLAAGRFVSGGTQGGTAFIGPEEIIQTLCVDRLGRLWVGTRSDGLILIDRAAGAARRFRHSASDPQTLGGDAVLTILEDRHGAIWAGGPGGLDRIDPGSGRIEHQRLVNEHIAAVSGGATKVTKLLEDHLGHIWVGSNFGLLRLEPGGGEVTTYTGGAGKRGSLPADRVQALLEDHAGRLWVGTAGGLALYDAHSDQFVAYRHNPANPATLPDDDVISLFEDRTGLLWVGTKTGGVAKWNSRSWSFGHHSGDAEGFADANPTGFAVDAAGATWISTLEQGLHAIDRQGHVTHYRHSARDATSLPDDRVMALQLDHDGALWIGTMSAGLSRLDRSTGQFTTFRHDPADPGTLGAPGVMSLLADSRGRIWAGTFGGGLSVLDRSTGRFHRYLSDPADPTTLSNNRATALAEDPTGRIWVGTETGGLSLLDPASGRFTRFKHRGDDAGQLSSNTVYAIHVDSQGQVWIGTRGGGLDQVLGSADHPETIRFRTYSEAEGLPNSTVYGVENDAAGRLWLSTNRGLVRLDPASGEVRSFSQADGLQGDEFNFGAHYRSANGELFFGGPGGYNAFVPEHLQFDEQAPPVVLTAFLKLNEPARTTQPHERLRSIDLGYRDDVVTFEFAALDFTSPADNRYRYKLDGFDPDWVDAGSKRRVTYTNLAGGHYTFRVKAANSDGKWNDAGLVLPLAVEAPPWATTWARIGYALALGLVIFAVWHSQQRKLLREAQYARRLAQDVRDRTAEVAQRNSELEALNRQLREASLTDPLTGLGNRRSLREAMPALTRRSADVAGSVGERRLALLVVDLDNLKPINDRYGHEAGDQILTQIAEILRGCCRSGDAIVRWGGDEFVIAYRDADAAAAEHLAERIRRRVAKQIFRLSAGNVTRTSCSIGFTCFPFMAEAPDFLTWEQTLAVADAALYCAKKERNGWIGWTGGAPMASGAAFLAELARNADALEREGSLIVRRPHLRSDDTIDELLTGALREGDR